MNYYVVDFVVLIEVFDIRNVVYIGYLIGGGEVVVYVVCYGMKWILKIVLVSVVLLVMVKSECNFGGMLIEVFDGFRR